MRKYNITHLVQGGVVGIKEFIDNKQIQIYPNPTANNLTISNKSKLSISHITITDILGQEMLNIMPEDKQTINVNMFNFANGVYFVKIYSDNDTFTLKLIKQ